MGSLIGPKLNNDGLIFCIDPMNDKCYQDGDTTLTDLSGNQPVTNLNGSTASEINGELITTGTDLNIVSPDLSTITSQLTFEMWIDVQDTSSNYSLYFIQTNGFGGYSLGVRGSDGVYLHYLGQGSATVGGWWVCGSNSDLRGDSENKWVHLVSTLDMSYTGSTNRWSYVNGVEDKTTRQSWTSSTIPTSTNDLKPSHDDFGNKIAFLRIYNRVLSATEVAENYTVMRGRFKE